MTKKLLCLCIAMLLLCGSLCSALCSCGNDGSGSDDSEQGMTVSEGTTFIWNDLLFYLTTTDTDDGKMAETRTLQYVNLKTDATEGVPVYSGAFADDGDPFCLDTLLSLRLKVLLDEEATAENGGVPVLLALLPFQQEDDEDTVYLRAVSYNMATGKMKVLCENVGDGVISFGVYGDTIYYTSVAGEIDPLVETAELEYFLYSLPKNGGKPTRLSFPKCEQCLDLKCSVEGMLYLQADNAVYRYDPQKDEAELLHSFPEEQEIAFFSGGYVYYRENKQTLKKDGFTDELFFDVSRQALKTLGENAGEKLLENVTRTYYDGKNLYYTCLGDGIPIPSEQWLSNGSVLRCFNLKTKESGVVFDQSDKEGVCWLISQIWDGYMLVSASTTNGELIPGIPKIEIYWNECLFNLQTGERRELTDF